MATPVYFTCTLSQAKSCGKRIDFTNITNLINDSAETCPDVPAAGFYLPNADQSWSTRVLSFAEILQGSCATAELIAQGIKIPEHQTVALLCPSTPDFLLTWLALMRLGHAVLLIAPQCSPSAIVGLCERCEVTSLFHDETYTELAMNAMHESKDQAFPLTTHRLPFGTGSNPFDLVIKPVSAKPQASNAAQDDVAYLHHTSGTSSSIPKPIPQTHFAGAGAYARFDGSHHATFTTTPLYHGGIADLFRAWTSNALIWLFPGKGVPITATNIIKCLDLAKDSSAPSAKYFASVPYVLEMMASDERGIERLCHMDIVAVGGAALPAEVGSQLIDAGIKLISRFGSAECGFLMSSHREYDEDQAWDYLRDSGDLRFEEREGDLYELVVPPQWPHISKTDKTSSDGSFATSDLFRPHPSIARAWKYDSRADSQLTMITGKKFDPAPLEDALAVKSSYIQDVLIFGNGKPCPGALIFRSREAKDISNDDLLQILAPLVEELNQESQSHARVPPSMLILMPYREAPLEKSSKGTVLRRLAEQRYTSEIDGAYEKDLSDQSGVPDEKVESFVLDVVRSIASTPSTHSTKLQPDTDLFAYGIDSVACVQIRHAVSKLLPMYSARLPLTIVQDTGSIHQLSQTLIDLRHERTISHPDGEDHTKLMHDFVAQYSSLQQEPAEKSQNLLLTPPGTPSPTQRQPGKVVLLTGPTGSLGSQLLSQLVSSPDVSHIHLLLRGTSLQAAEERVRDALSSRKLAVPADFDCKVSVHTCRLSESLLGLKAETHARLVQEVDVIFHLAWAVDFVLPLQGFKQHFAGLQGLLKLSLAHSRYALGNGSAEAAQVVFCSSTASVSSYEEVYPHQAVPENVLTNAKYSGRIGYSRSKWVAENILHEAVKAHSDLKGAVSIVRVGQLSGDSFNGVWNKSEAYPLMMNSAKVTGCLPALAHESVGWLPVDTAATAFLELGISRPGASNNVKTDDLQVVHLLSQDRTTTWNMLLDWLQAVGNFEVVKPKQWLRRLDDLSKSNSSESQPCLKLLEFWKMAYGGDASEPAASDEGLYRTEKSMCAMPCLKSVKPVDKEYALKLWTWIQENV
ncbi:Putative AMP-dependent synthetase/ligase, phosphopantetheine binding ACP domain, ANL [Septoria linicola]|uniref:AMP-dependent synthetase/ligase, phosphopantetheine binding ACP domain, ANL n=1 Tax=Septoria linicola TaxID=215465 RepID=A0A9Q9AH45_9PEZI|nr:Putative AMP-dependent synthetase/ligase, phosphopantetheine binding ACP domain, ANL [Septoria linicola]